MMSAKRSRGFTIVEVSVVSGMMAALVMVVSMGWRSIGKAAVDIIARSELVQEMDLTIASLTRDLGGCAVNTTGQIATSAPRPPEEPSSVSEIDHLKLTQDDGASYIEYQLDSTNSDLWKRNNLVRTYYDASTGKTTTFTVARNVDSFLASWDPGASKLKLTITFSSNYRSRDTGNNPTYDRTHSLVKRTCVLVACQPL